MAYGKTIPAGLKEGDLRVQGARVHFRQAGRGADIVLLHGAGNGDGQDWLFSAFAQLAENHRVTAFDRPGIGASELIDGADDPRRQAGHLAAASRALGLRRRLLIGHSYGATVALAWALVAGNTPSGMVLTAPVAYEPPAPDAIFGLLAKPVLGPALAWVVCRLMRGPAMGAPLKKVFSPQDVPPAYRDHAKAALLKNPAEVVANAREMLGLARPIGEMARGYGAITLPVVILQGDSDANMPHESQAGRLACDLPNAELWLKPGIGHMAHHFLKDDLLAAVRRVAAKARPNGAGSEGTGTGTWQKDKSF